MDSRPVYQSLIELFPQVDSRILKAVAIEHSNDVNAAVEFILCEALPLLSGPLEASNMAQVREQDASDQGAETAFGTVISGDTTHLVSVECQNPTVSPFSREAEEENVIDVETYNLSSSVTILEENCVTANSGNRAFFAPPFIGKAEDSVIDIESDTDSTVSSLDEHPALVGCSSPVKDMNKFISELEEELSRCSLECTGTSSAALESNNDMSASVTRSMDSVKSGADVVKDIISDLGEGEEQDSRCLIENRCELFACDNEVVSLEENDLPMLLSTRSGHLINIDFLEDRVTDAKSNKKTLVSAVESVVNLMKEAELLEERAKQAKEEASSSGQDILTQVEELTQMLSHAKKANDMHAGEVYGEKAILSTEARELQSRLLGLSDERNKSHSIVDEIRETLEARLAAARDEITAAEQEKLEREELAQKALNEQEDIMYAVAQESRKLNDLAEENAKLREFLVDRGRVVDTLQGEIAVICEDVMSLKKRVDERAPLKGSLLMHYSSASSSSSFSQKSAHSAGGILVAVEPGVSSSQSNGNGSRIQEQENIVTNTRESSEDGSKVKEQENTVTTSIMQDFVLGDEWEVLRREVGMA